MVPRVATCPDRSVGITYIRALYTSYSRSCFLPVFPFPSEELAPRLFLLPFPFLFLLSWEGKAPNTFRTASGFFSILSFRRPRQFRGSKVYAEILPALVYIYTQWELNLLCVTTQLLQNLAIAVWCWPPIPQDESIFSTMWWDPSL